LLLAKRHVVMFLSVSTECNLSTVSRATTPGCRRRVHSDVTSAGYDQRRLVSGTLDISKRPAAAAAVSARRRKHIGCIFHRRVDTNAQLSGASLSSIAHLRTGRYYRWNPDISSIPASQWNEDAGTVLCKSPVDVSESDDSAAGSPWQHKAILCSDSDSTEASYDVTSSCLQQPLGDKCHMQVADDDEMKARREACRRLYMLETRYTDEMADGILQFVRPLCGAILSQSDNKTLFQNVEKVHMSVITLYNATIRS